ncbi:MAG TPA: molybdenum cofactor biosynthesis protein, partial [Verrucomicrobiae bacterium]|nr:molybdenum cofactor biosynthesis protein [Verrucomicrobiae bacterium]
MFTVGVITASDKGARGEREDLSGELIKQMVGSIDAQVLEYCIV